MLGRDDPIRSFAVLVLTLVGIAVTGWLLVLGKGLLLPIFIAVISVYILVSTSDWMGRQPGLERLPAWLRRALVLLLFVLALATLTGVIITTTGQVVARLPDYQENLTSLANRLAAMAGFDDEPNWQLLWDETAGQINLQRLATRGVSSVSSLAGLIFVVIVYSAFLMGERGGFARKVATALPGESAAQTQAVVADINRSIGDYLAVKTLINVILAGISFGVLLLLRVDFALFWAILIGLLNYIPYVGSLLGVTFPVLLTLAQFGSFAGTVIAAVCLSLTQIFVGSALEPRMIGRRINMSPFVVLASLALWSSLWGIAGAMLAIPMTSIIAIIMANYQPTRPLAVMLAEDVTAFEQQRPHGGVAEPVAGKMVGGEGLEPPTSSV